MCYRAGDGTIVRPAVPAEWAREPVPGADEPCPACGAVTWERVTPPDDSRPPVIACGRCGHEVGDIAWSRTSRFDLGTLRAPWRRLRARRQQRRSLLAMRPAPPAIDALDFPVYTLAGAEAELPGHGSDLDGVHSVTMRHDGIAVTTRALRRVFLDADDESASALGSVIESAEPLRWGRGSDDARTLHIEAHRRAVGVRVAGAEPFTAELPVGGEPVRFAGLRDPAGWAAVGEPATCGSWSPPTGSGRKRSRSAG